jgi:rhamnogalacturonyl hydrolase YesR
MLTPLLRDRPLKAARSLSELLHAFGVLVAGQAAIARRAGDDQFVVELKAFVDEYFDEPGRSVVVVNSSNICE